MLACGTIGPGVVALIFGIIFSPLIVAAIASLFYLGLRRPTNFGEPRPASAFIRCLWTFAVVIQGAVLLNVM